MFWLNELQRYHWEDFGDGLDSRLRSSQPIENNLDRVSETTWKTVWLCVGFGSDVAFDLETRIAQVCGDVWILFGVRDIEADWAGLWDGWDLGVQKVVWARTTH